MKIEAAKYLLLAALFLAGTAGQAQQPRSDAELWVWVPLAKFNPNAPLGWNLAQTGYLQAETLNKRIDTAIALCREAGVKPTILLQLPYGDDGVGAMDFSSRLDVLYNPKLVKARDFARWLALRKALNPDVPYVVRLGDATRDPRLEALRKAGDIGGYRSVWHRSLLDLPIDVPLAVDSIEELPIDHPAAALLEYERAMGRVVYSEPWPIKGSAVETWPFIVSEKLAFRSKNNPRWNPVPEDQVSNEVIVHNVRLRGKPTADFVSRVRERGWIPAVGYGAVRSAVEGFK